MHFSQEQIGTRRIPLHKTFDVDYSFGKKAEVIIYKYLFLTTYQDGNLAVIASPTESLDTPYRLMVSVNLVASGMLDTNEFALNITNLPELSNEAMMKAGIYMPTPHSIKQGYVMFPIMRLNQQYWLQHTFNNRISM